ncbi:RNA-binding protein [Oscillatoria sp. FACHB-1407]|uniref:RNA recognition motif domain-containing protein n=1 Tax=Oscillatoria sp. FACHB-1407 TaxID=2692847 RepID=UPI0016851DC6|nr:RNA-binding protein [Oscillatoria sp. FACHB-1407]MBD2465346.1 RNA-binding protein [Oscillatoria sp. FACHB-1407]
MSIRLYVGNLPKELEKQELQAVFADFDESVTTKIITDRKTGKCRGFGFVTVKSDEQADQLIEKFNGFMFKDQPLKIEKALPRSKGSEDEQQQSPAASSPAASSSSNNRKKGGGNNKSKKTTTVTDSEAVQPDPRWAQELEKLKQLLAAQTANS